jgi:hypothetical protein
MVDIPKVTLAAWMKKISCIGSTMAENKIDNRDLISLLDEMGQYLINSLK